MKKLSRFFLPPLTMVSMTIALATPGWAHNSVVNVSLWDKGSDAAMADGLGMGMSGVDISNATMGIKLSKSTVESGHITFQVTNSSKDTIHEMVVAPAGDGSPLPFSKNENEVREDKISHLGEVSELDPGATGSVTLTLKPGKYILFCNVAGHYMNGMWALLTVT